MPLPSRTSKRVPRSAIRIGRSKTGLGLFAVAPIKKGTFILRYWGRKIPTKLCDELDNKYLFEINSRWTVDGSTRRNTARYINHSCRPNAESDIKKGIIIIRAIKNIQPGDEITYDYGKGYFETFIKPLGCKCRACVEKRRLARSGAKRVKRGAARSGAKQGAKTSRAKAGKAKQRRRSA